MPGGVYDSGKSDSGDCAELRGEFFVLDNHPCLLHEEIHLVG